MSEFPNQEESIFPDIEGRPKTNSNTYTNTTNFNKNNKKTNSYTNRSIDSNDIYTGFNKGVEILAKGARIRKIVLTIVSAVITLIIIGFMFVGAKNSIKIVDHTGSGSNTTYYTGSGRETNVNINDNITNKINELLINAGFSESVSVSELYSDNMQILYVALCYIRPGSPETCYVSITYNKQDSTLAIVDIKR